MKAAGFAFFWGDSLQSSEQMLSSLMKHNCKIPKTKLKSESRIQRHGLSLFRLILTFWWYFCQIKLSVGHILLYCGACSGKWQILAQENFRLVVIYRQKVMFC